MPRVAREGALRGAWARWGVVQPRAARARQQGRVVGQRNRHVGEGPVDGEQVEVWCDLIDRVAQRSAQRQGEGWRRCVAVRHRT